MPEQRLACREASSTGHELDVPQQFGVWQVAGLGIVVAFRGTASQEDVIIDANISPVPLDAARVTRGEFWTACGVAAQSGFLKKNL